MAISNVTDLYRDILGREPDAEGLAFWQQGFGDTVDPNEIASFTQAAQSELANRPAAEQVLLAPKIVDTTATGVTDADILGWFNANPNADDATIARVMKEAAVTPEQVARATNTNFTDVNNRYLAATGANNTNTFTDAITSGTSTTQDDLLSTLANNTADTTVATDTTADTSADTVSAADKLLGQILAQGTTSYWTGEGYGSVAANAENMTKLLTDIGITDISQFGVLPVYADVQEIGKTYNGQRVFTSTDENTGQPFSYIVKPSGQYDQDGNETSTIVEVPSGAKLETMYGLYDGGEGYTTVDASKLKTVDGKLVADTGQTTYGNKVTGQAVPNTYSERQTGNAWGGTFLGDGNTGYRVKFDAKGNPIFYTTYASSSDIADWGPILQLAAVIPSPIQPFAIAANAAIAIENDDIFGGIAALAGLAGFSDVAAGARILKAVDSGDAFAIVSSIMNSPFGGDIGGTMLTDTISLMDVGNALNVANNISNENYAGALTSLGQLTGSSDVKTAAAAARVIRAISSNNPAAVATAMIGLDHTLAAASKVTDKNVALNITNTLADANSAATEGTQLASLASDTVSDAGNDLTLSGAGGETLNLDDFSGSDSVAADAALFDSSVGDLDATGNITDTTGLDMGDVITTDGNITDTTGLDTGEVIPDTGDGVEELVVTGTGDKADTTTDTTTDTDTVVNDKGEVVIKGSRESCPVGTKLNPVTGDCDPDWDEGGGDVCGVGEHQDPETGMCVPDVQTIICPPGKVLNEAGTACIDEVIVKAKAETCPVGTTLNPITGDCDPDWDEGGGEVCGVGERLDPETGMCVPIEDEAVKCEDGFHLGPDGKTCVADEKEEDCAEGFHLENGICVADDDTKEDTECPEGYVRNLETGTCEKVEDKSCPVGQVRNADGKCVPVTQPPKPCPTGYQRVGGVCVPIKKVVPPIVPTGYLPSGASGPGERTDPIYAGAMDDFDLFATLEELLKENPDKKKDTKKSKDKTKMATGGHLDDLLAEQMTVDDLLKLLR